MTRLPRFARPNCPDQLCNAAIGEEHEPGCDHVICLTTGTQRLPHLADPPGGGHDCGRPIWAGYPHGSIEAVAQGWFVRPAAIDTGGTVTRWVPCSPNDPDAVPDLDRIVRHGRWNPIRQVFEIRHATPDFAVLVGR